MPEKTKGQGFSEVITTKLDKGTLEILLQVEVSAEGNTVVTVFKGVKKEEPAMAKEGERSTPDAPHDEKTQ